MTTRLSLGSSCCPFYLQQQLDDLTFADVLLVGNDGTARAHGVVLGATCNLFIQCWDEGQEYFTVLLPDFSVAEIRDFLAFLYGGKETAAAGGGSLAAEFRFLFGPNEDSAKVRIKDEDEKDSMESDVSPSSDEEDEDMELVRCRRRKRRMPKQTFAFEPDPFRPGHLLCPRYDSCGFSHPKRSSVLQHVNIVHHKIRCPHCPALLSKTTLEEHVARRHTKMPTHPCDNCHKMFYSRRDRETHRNKEHGVATEHVVCDLCGKNFTSRVVYGNHRFKCKINPVRREMVPYTCVLNPEDPTLCPVEDCGYRNKSSVAIKRWHYRKKHERQVCPHCGKTYAYYGMKEHIAKEHSKDQLKFSCDDCDQKFFNETSLREHRETTHIRAKLYVCEKCGQGFFSRKQVARHKNEAHNQSKHNPCPICGKVYRHKKSLRNHLAAAHGDGSGIDDEEIKEENPSSSAFQTIS